MSELLTTRVAFGAFSTSDLRVDVVTSAGGTSADYSETVGNEITPEEALPQNKSSEPSQWALQWLSSDAAKQYEGLWVALGSDLVVHALGQSPSELRVAIDGRPDLVILYVIPESVQLIGGGRIIAHAR